MNCEKAKELILSGVSEKGLTEHAASCADCRSMAAAWSALRELRPETPVPSDILDFKIKDAAAAHITRRRHGHNALIRRFAIYAAAACCVLVTWFSLDSLNTNSKMEQSVRPWVSMDMGSDFYALMAELDLGISSISSEFFPELGDEPDELDLIIRAGEPIEG